jgi:hypothetical protein
MHVYRVIKKFNESAAPNRRLETSIICALSHSEAITTRKTKPYRLLGYCRGLSAIVEDDTGVSLPAETTIEDMFFMAKHANLKTPSKNGVCTIKKEAKKAGSTIEQMKRDGEEAVGEGWMKSPSGGVYYSPKGVPFAKLADALSYKSGRREPGGLPAAGAAESTVPPTHGMTVPTQPASDSCSYVVGGEQIEAGAAAAAADASAAAMSDSGIEVAQARLDELDELNIDDWFEFGDDEDEDQTEMVLI